MRRILLAVLIASSPARAQAPEQEYERAVSVLIARDFPAGVARLIDAASPRETTSIRRGCSRAPKSLLARLAELGYTIDQSAEIEAYLDRREANAATFGTKDLLLRPDARLIEALEEYLHNLEIEAGLDDRLTLGEREIAVKRFMVDHRASLGLLPCDTKPLEAWLERLVKSGRVQTI